MTPAQLIGLLFKQDYVKTLSMHF